MTAPHPAPDRRCSVRKRFTRAVTGMAVLGLVTLGLPAAASAAPDQRTTERSVTDVVPAPVEAKADPRADFRLTPATVIRADHGARQVADYLRFARRGAMLDVARHFFKPDQIKLYIDQIAQYKINTLHLHLADDQGWRIEIKSWPRLATFGGSTAVDGDPGGYYTQQQY